LLLVIVKVVKVVKIGAALEIVIARLHVFVEVKQAVVDVSVAIARFVALRTTVGH
jgi:hypothetical protein